MASCPGLPGGASIVRATRRSNRGAEFLATRGASGACRGGWRASDGGDCSEAAAMRGHTAPKALGRDVPQLLLAQADEVIE